MNQNMPFNVFLLISIFGHASILGMGKLMPVAPQFAVTQAPASVEVTLVKEIKPKVEIQEEVKKENIQEVVEIKTFEEEIKQEEIPVVERRGSLSEARPLEYQNKPPVYPETARRKGSQGRVLLNVLVGTNGCVSEVVVEETSGFKILDEAAVSAVQKWKFIPAQIGGIKFSSRIKIPIKFVLEES